MMVGKIQRILMMTGGMKMVHLILGICVQRHSYCCWIQGQTYRGWIWIGLQMRQMGCHLNLEGS